ncbi:YT521-B-like domain-containing protein [Aspergillus floccosus]
MSPTDSNASSDPSKSTREDAPAKDVRKSDRRHRATNAPQLSGTDPPWQNSTPSDSKMYPYPEQPYMTPGRHEPSSALNMGDMQSSMPAYQHRPMFFEHHSIPHHYVSPNAAHGPIYPVHPMSPYGTPAPNTSMTFTASYSNVYPPYYPQQHPNSPMHHASHAYPSQVAGSQMHVGVPLMNQSGGYAHGYYPQPVYMSSRQGHKSAPPDSSGQTHPRPSAPSKQTTSKPHSAPPRDDLNLEYDVSKTIVDGSTPMRNAPATSPSKARGPLRKPKQSGHALWVGNLPSGTNIVDLKDFFARDMNKDLESVFLISKSNCAFVNYKTERACLAALSRFHDSRFQGARLVCRLRRADMMPGSATDGMEFSATTPLRGGDGDDTTTTDQAEIRAIERNAEERRSDTRVPNRYFVVKSLTVEDLEHSRRTGVWATQSHNKVALNEAYETADNVYLIFSANKSGEYYGYARMMAPIQADETLASEVPPRTETNPTEAEPLSVTSTPASETAPNGRIIDDPARGTIFWEADTSEEEGDGRSEKSAGCDVVEEPAESGFQSIGGPFRIRWCSTERVPFHRTRGLRNPWNANREVKIARDGTEIEPSVGERLIQLFHTPHAG